MMNIDRANEIKGSLLWADICEELDIKIFHLTNKLRDCKVDELEKIQQEIRVYESVKKLPEDVIDREETPK